MEERENNIKQAFLRFKNKMSEIKKRQLVLFGKADKIVTEEKAQEIRKKINNLQ
jgi:esterase/lipase